MVENELSVVDPAQVGTPDAVRLCINCAGHEAPPYAETVPDVVSAKPVRFWILSVPLESIEVVPVPPYARVRPEIFVVDALVVVEVNTEIVLKFEVEDAFTPFCNQSTPVVAWLVAPKLVAMVNG